MSKLTECGIERRPPPKHGPMKIPVIRGADGAGQEFGIRATAQPQGAVQSIFLWLVRER